VEKIVSNSFARYKIIEHNKAHTYELETLIFNYNFLIHNKSFFKIKAACLLIFLN